MKYMFLFSIENLMNWCPNPMPNKNNIKSNMKSKCCEDTPFTIKCNGNCAERNPEWPIARSS